MQITIIMSKVNEQIERKKKDVDTNSRKPVIEPNSTGTGIINE